MQNNVKSSENASKHSVNESKRRLSYAQQSLTIPQAIERTVGLSGTRKKLSEDRSRLKYNCLQDYNYHKETRPFTVALDWLQMGIVLTEGLGLEDGIPELKVGKYKLIRRDVGTTRYTHCYRIYVGQDEYHTLEVFPRNARPENKRNAIVKFQNHLLYSEWWLEWQEFKEALVERVDRISRLDIAIDGMNHIYDLLCDWTQKKTDKPKKNGFAVKLIGRSNVNGGKINRLTRNHENYRIGSTKGLRQIAIYNKTKDIDRLSKSYIKDYWEANGIDSTADVYRFEMRLFNGFLNQMELGENINNVLVNEHGELIESTINPDELLDMMRRDSFKLDFVRKACEKFFEWIYVEDKNVTRCTRLNLFPKPPEHDLIRVGRTYNGTAYKAKMQVHNTFYQVAKKIVGIEEGIAIIQKQIDVYDLQSWYGRRKGEFLKRYPLDCPNEMIQLMTVDIDGKIRSSDRNVRDRMREITNTKNAKQLNLKLKK